MGCCEYLRKTRGQNQENIGWHGIQGAYTMENKGKFIKESGGETEKVAGGQAPGMDREGGGLSDRRPKPRLDKAR